MKKVLLSLTLFMASFFFITLDKVRADVTKYEYTIPVTDFDYINDEFLLLREKVIEYCKENNKSYYIRLYDKKIQADIFDYSSHTISFYKGNPEFTLNKVTYSRYQLINGELSLVSNNLYGPSFWLYDSKNNFTYTGLLDTNIPNFILNNANIEFSFAYGDKTYDIKYNDNFLSLYDIYLDINAPVIPDEPVVEDKYTEEKEVINNFYSTIFTKISDLATSFSTNYIFLLIFGIFILIFVFELIWRRFI